MAAHTLLGPAPRRTAGAAGRRRRRRPVRPAGRPPRLAPRHHPRRVDLFRDLGLGALRGGDRTAPASTPRSTSGWWSAARAGQPEDGDRLPRRRPHGDDDVRRHLRLADGAHLHHRLHGRRPGLQALLRLHLAVHLLDADAGDEQQLPAAVLRLGGGGPGLLPADRLLVHPADGDLRQHEGLPGQPGRRLRLHPRHRPDRRLRRHAELRRGLRPRRRAREAGLSRAPTGG